MIAKGTVVTRWVIAGRGSGLLRDPELCDEKQVFTKKAVVMSALERLGEQDTSAELSRFRTAFCGCLPA